jgi:hypothetical protein
VDQIEKILKTMDDPNPFQEKPSTGNQTCKWRNGLKIILIILIIAFIVFYAC